MNGAKVKLFVSGPLAAQRIMDALRVTLVNLQKTKVVPKSNSSAWALQTRESPRKDKEILSLSQVIPAIKMKCMSYCRKKTPASTARIRGIAIRDREPEEARNKSFPVFSRVPKQEGNKKLFVF